MCSPNDRTLQVHAVIILSMATWLLAGSGNAPLQPARTRSDTNFQEEYLAFSKKLHAHISIKKPLGLGPPDHTVPYGTVFSRARFPRHCVPGYDRHVPTGRPRVIGVCPQKKSRTPLNLDRFRPLLPRIGICPPNLEKRPAPFKPRSVQATGLGSVPQNLTKNLSWTAMASAPFALRRLPKSCASSNARLRALNLPAAAKR